MRCRYAPTLPPIREWRQPESTIRSKDRFGAYAKISPTMNSTSTPFSLARTYAMAMASGRRSSPVTRKTALGKPDGKQARTAPDIERRGAGFDLPDGCLRYFGRL